MFFADFIIQTEVFRTGTELIYMIRFTTLNVLSRHNAISKKDTKGISNGPNKILMTMRKLM